jgi:type IV secretory pathway VirB2 component (pilin)
MQKSEITIVAARAPHEGERRSRLDWLSLSKFVLLATFTVASAQGQSDPWSTAAGRLATVLTGPVARGLALVAIVLGGLQMAFSEGTGKRAIGGLIFGLGMALSASSFLSWLFL